MKLRAARKRRSPASVYRMQRAADDREIDRYRRALVAELLAKPEPLPLVIDVHFAYPCVVRPYSAAMALAR